MARKAQADVLAEIERARTHGEAPNLRGWNLSVRRLRDIDLTGADLTNANLHGAQFEKVNLTGATLENADLRKARFGDSTLLNTNFTGTNLEEANLASTTLTGTNLTNANLTYAWLQGADLRTATLTNTNLHGAEFDSGVWISTTYEPRQLLNTRGLNPAYTEHGIPQEVWDQILPTNPAARELLEELLNDWDRTLQQAISTAELLHTA